MWWRGGQNDAQFGKVQFLHGLLRRSQVAVVNRIEGAAKDADHDGRYKANSRYKIQDTRYKETGARFGAECRQLVKACLYLVSCILNLFPDMPVAEHDEFHRGQAFQSNRSARVQLVGGNADLR